MADLCGQMGDIREALVAEIQRLQQTIDSADRFDDLYDIFPLRMPGLGLTSIGQLELVPVSTDRIDELALMPYALMYELRLDVYELRLMCPS